MNNEQRQNDKSLVNLAVLYIAYRVWKNHKNSTKTEVMAQSDTSYNLGFIAAKLVKKLVK